MHVCVKAEYWIQTFAHAEALHFIPKRSTVKSGQSFLDTVCHIYRKQDFSDLKKLLQT